MTEEQLAAEASTLSPWQRHRFVVLIGLTIVVSLFLVSVALALYASSGAAQLDLSRPGYTSVRDKVERSDSFSGFSATGPVDKETLEKFRKLYDEQAEKATNFDSFGGNVMSDKALSIDAPK
ncbi:MAG TPA: hypothetical protein VFS14_01500 [Candidatus Saccharimonadales bacterium]|nr:hypothetical protein [Candidatus Saccharimonadales bacterium]